jgi:hypothetical protein
MLLSNKLKEVILGKFKIDNKVTDINAKNKSNVINSKKKQIPYGDIYTTDNILQDDVVIKQFANSLPTDKSMSTRLPSITELIYREPDNVYSTMSPNLPEKNYKYSVQLNESHPFSIHTNSHIHLIIYKIDNSNTNQPYLSFILSKNQNTNDNVNTLFFPELKSANEDELKNRCIEQIYFLFGKSINMLPIYKGYKSYGNNYYLFYDATKCKSGINVHWTTVHEIVNAKKYLNQPIAPVVYNYLLHNHDIITLYTLDDLKIETPTIGYCGNATDTIELSKLSSYHYFYTSLEDAISDLENDENVYRFVIFKGKTIILSHEDYKNKEIINDILNNNVLANTIYYEKIMPNLKTISVIIVKHTSQIMPASCHLLPII